MSNAAAQIHHACHEAIMACPQFRGYDDDQLVQVSGGRFVRFGDVPDGGIEAVIRFWRDPGTEVNRLLFELGYENELPASVRSVFARYDELVARALNELAAEL